MYTFSPNVKKQEAVFKKLHTAESTDSCKLKDQALGLLLECGMVLMGLLFRQRRMKRQTII